jgi:hypothetical protein
MKLAKKSKRRPCLPLFAWIKWPCGDITQHEVISHVTYPYKNPYREYELASSFGPIWKRWDEIETIAHASDGPRGWKDTPEWTSGEGECGICPTTRKETK